MKRIIASVFPILMVLGMVLSALVIVTALQAAPTAANPGAPIEKVSVAQPVDPVAEGRKLFVAKGCIVCHVNERASTLREGQMEFPDIPNLTKVKLDSDYLRRWLHDPAAMKPTTTMPNLGLSVEEIEALTAFLVAGNE